MLRGVFGTGRGREWSNMRNVARSTGMTLWHRGHDGFIWLPLTPSRYESGVSQCGQGRNEAYAMGFLS